jgi:4-carboxymuconolactone decarboxylase
MVEHTHGRLAWLAPDELDEARRRVYDAIVGGPRAADADASPIVSADGRLEGPFNSMLVSPAVGKALQSLGSAIRYETELTDRARELAILAVAAHHRSNFEWSAHERLARATGLDDETLRAVRQGERPPGLLEAEDSIWRATRSMLVSGDLDDEEYGRMEASFGQAAVVELIVLVGYYQSLALILRTLRVPVPSTMKMMFSDWPDSGGER